MSDIKPIRKIAQSRFGQAEHNIMVWSAKAEAGTTIEDLLRPECWVHITQFFAGPYRHEIIVYDDENKFRLHLAVRSHGPGWARVVELGRHEWNVPKAKDVVVPTTGDYDVVYRGAAKWSVLRTSDKHIMVEGLAEKQQAADFLTNLLAKTAA